MDLSQLTIKQIRSSLLKREFSAMELANASFSEIESKDRNINAFLSLTQELAQSQAKEIDEKISSGQEIGTLAGVPVAVKDNILIDGYKCTAGSKILENYISAYDATVVKKLKSAGALIVGKTNLDEFAMGSSTENSAYFPTKNPNDSDRVPGGSSGGSAAAVASGMAVASLGSDTGGSIREPASFCGVVGLKPTYGSVSRHGLIAMASSLDQIGPFARNVEDAALVFEAIAGKDDKDSTSFNQEKHEAVRFLNDPIKGLKIGIPEEYFAQGLDKEVEKITRQSIDSLTKLGAEIVPINLPNSQYALATYYVIMPCEVSANLSRFDGIKYGLSRQQGENLSDVYFDSRGFGFGPEAKRRIMLGTFALSAGYYDAYYLKAQKVRSVIINDFKKAFEKVDVIAGPVCPTPAFKIGEKINDPLQMYLADIYTITANLAGLPALSLPVGKSGKLPVGLHLIGRHLEEAKILNIAYVLEQYIAK